LNKITSFLAGLFVGAAVVGIGAQAFRIEGNLGINHVGLSVERMQDAITYYTKTFGFDEAAVLRDDKGEPILAFIQVSRNTFIELSPATATRPPGLDHFGLHVTDMKSAVASLKQHGVNVGDGRPGRTVTLITGINNPGGVRMELSELGPDSLLGKAIAGWH